MCHVSFAPTTQWSGGAIIHVQIYRNKGDTSEAKPGPFPAL